MMTLTEWMLANQSLWEAWPRDKKRIRHVDPRSGRVSFIWVAYDKRESSLRTALRVAGFKRVNLENAIAEARYQRRQKLKLPKPEKTKYPCWCCEADYHTCPCYYPKCESCRGCVEHCRCPEPNFQVRAPRFYKRERETTPEVKVHS